MTNNQRPWSPPQIIWSAIIGIALWSAVGFSWFGPGFGWSTKGGSNLLTENIVTENLATICVAQAYNAPGAEAALKEFSELSSYKQSDFVKTSGWAIMPGSESAANATVKLCASKLRQS
jgi:hypothetical protein